MGDRQVFQIGAARQVDGQKAAALSLAMATGEDEGHGRSAGSVAVKGLAQGGGQLRPVAHAVE